MSVYMRAYACLFIEQFSPSRRNVKALKVSSRQVLNER